MQRKIFGFGRDQEGDWVAHLSCGHPQHVRHSPPFVERMWVTTSEGRAKMLGQELSCVRCDQLEWPNGLVAYKHTSTFTEQTIPDGLLGDHATKAGVWAQLQVKEGTLRYVCDSLGIDMIVTPEASATIVPEVLHRVALSGPVRFCVTFFRTGAS